MFLETAYNLMASGILRSMVRIHSSKYHSIYIYIYVVTQKLAETEHRPGIPPHNNIFPNTIKVGIQVNELINILFLFTLSTN